MTDTISADSELSTWISVAHDPAMSGRGPKILRRPDRLDPNIEVELVISRESGRAPLPWDDARLDTLTIAGTCWSKRNGRQLESNHAIVKDQIAELLSEEHATCAFEVDPEPGSGIAFFNILIDSENNNPTFARGCRFSRVEDGSDEFDWIP